MAGVNIVGLSKQYTIGDHSFYALKDIDLNIDDGSFTTIVGKSGCGKTTLLRLLCGLEKQTEGTIDFTSGKETCKTAKRVGIVFQEPRLMHWLTVKENILFSLCRETKSAEKEELAEKYLQIMGLAKFKDAYPSQISGGMAQRTALGRTLCYDPELILMDEPFAALDYFTRKNLQEEMVNLFLAYGKTIIFVTHNVEEALFLGQKVVIVEGGRIIQIIPVDFPYPRSYTSLKSLGILEEIIQTINYGQKSSSLAG
ncbi:MAG: ABC transporter ATP-binding protein [Peptococcaceae bacterium]|nr:ABC transporter ATP-binding protein [Peptococcaceae bacterium]